MERSRRCVLWLVSLIFAALIAWKGHSDPEKGNSVAFLHYSASSVMVRILGKVPTQGIYDFSDDITMTTVMEMTGVRYEEKWLSNSCFAGLLKSGTIVDVVRRNGQHVEIRLLSMKAHEKILLGIPLDPDSMDINDWDCLPGIGLSTAKKIIDDRQKNGEFGSLKAVGRVPGMGVGRIDNISKYF